MNHLDPSRTTAEFTPTFIVADSVALGRQCDSVRSVVSEQQQSTCNKIVGPTTKRYLLELQQAQQAETARCTPSPHLSVLASPALSIVHYKCICNEMLQSDSRINVVLRHQRWTLMDPNPTSLGTSSSCLKPHAQR